MRIDINEIKNAINNNKKLKFNYGGLPREVEPYIYGEVNSKENTQIHAYQTGGKSLQSELGWRNFRIADISNLEILNEKDRKSVV